ncbi:MAG: sigma-70 family RNA polymerase sigma factor [Acidobacteriia bacterium]|nr:sigma-70 family RNA polymerase sigma factor [Terriglobia bacterium]
MTNHGVQPIVEASAGLESVITELYEKSGNSGLSREQFGVILSEVAAKYLPADASARQTAELYASLRVEELALARACAAGHERAWEVFMARYREKLYDIAAYIAKESSAARELADSLYADLYGTTTRDGQRISKLASYTGRGSLEGWLRTVMAQEFVNRFRRQRRLVSLDEENEDGAQFAATDPEPAVAVDPRVETATDEALSRLAPEDRFLLASHYLDGRTLAEIARTLTVHESTVSRKIDKLAKSLRKQILAALERKGMSRRQAEEALDVDVRDMRLNIRDRVAQETASQTFSDKKGEVRASDVGPRASGV